jgi:Mn2+/Fe2+ NRAMP family transporter
MGAVVMPVFLWVASIWLVKKYQFIHLLHKKSKETLWNLLNVKQKVLFIALFVTAFLFMELFWRMLFEFLIAYMQIRDALVSG